MSIFNLEGKRVLITGASSGIGRACAVMASDLGASVVLSGRREDALIATLAVCKGGGHMICAGDITEAGFVAQLVEKAGKIDGLVHAAGIGPACPVGMITTEHLESVMKTNYFAFIELMTFYSRRKFRADRFSAVAVSSVSALAGWGGVAAYSGSKGALNSSVRALAVELASKGVRVNAVCPSNIKTPMFDAVASEMNSDESIKSLIAKQPLGLGSPEQVASPVCFLLSDAASFITGVNLPVDGGYLAQ